MTELMQRRRALMGAVKKARLPAEYQEVEYIQSSGTQAIITPCWLKQNSVIYCEFEYISAEVSVTYPQTFGCANPSVGFARANDTDQRVYVSFGNATDKNIDHVPSFMDAFHSCHMAADGTSFDETYSVSYNATVSENPSRNIALFARMGTSNNLERFSHRKIRTFQIRENGIIVLDLVPCYRKADGEIGMYDLVSKTFLANVGTGTFTKGADV